MDCGNTFRINPRAYRPNGAYSGLFSAPTRKPQALFAERAVLVLQVLEEPWHPVEQAATAPVVLLERVLSVEEQAVRLPIYLQVAKARARQILASAVFSTV